MILSVALMLVLLSCNVAFYLYVRKLKKIIYVKDSNIKDLEMSVGYAEAGLDMCNKKINSLTSQVNKLNSDNKLLTDKLSKLSNQFKNVSSYLKDN